MKKLLIFLLLDIFYVTAAWAQLSPAQIEMLKKYQSQKAGAGNGEIERYHSPDFYGQSPDSLPVGFRTPSSSDNPGQQGNQNLKTAKKDSLQGNQICLKLFGHDIFNNQESSFMPDAQQIPPEGYIFGPGDNIIVNVWGRVDLELDLTVDREGKIFIPKAGEIVAAGCTLKKLTGRIKHRLNRVYSDYRLSVTYGKLRRLSIYVFGEVQKPGGYTVSALATVLHALYLAGGISENGSLRKIKLIRHNKIVATYDFYDFLLKGDISQELNLLSGDIVYVPVVGPLVTIAGEVKRPAIYELSGGETITEAIALAGGPTAQAYLASVSLDRVGPGDNRILQDINLAEPDTLGGQAIKLRDGDRITIYSIYDKHKNRVYLAGNVKHPGFYGLDDTMSVAGLIADGEQLKEDTYLARADLYRVGGNGDKSLLAVNLQEILDHKGNFQLKPLDSLVVYSNKQVNRIKHISIGGEVKKPGRYILYDGMRLSDLIFAAGNLNRQAYLVQCEVARLNSSHKTDIINVDLEDVLLRKNKDADLPLKEDDHVFIRKLPDWKPVQLVTIEGEVLFPGKYAICNEQERLSDLIKRAGGLTPSAFPKGAIFYRKSIERDIARRNIGQVIKNTQDVYYDSLGNITSDSRVNFDPSQLNRIIIDLPGILKHPGSAYDITLSDSDYIYIPNQPSGVQVVGAVAANGTISYQKNKKYSYYLAQAGGLTPDGDKSQIRLVKPNGMVYYGGRARKAAIEPGDAIVIPAKLKHKTNWGRILSTSAAIISTMATTALIIDRVR